jgi:hypothetical protein
VLETVGKHDPPPEHLFNDYLQYLRTLASYAWTLDHHPDGEALGLLTAGFDSSEGRVRLLSTDHSIRFEWSEDRQNDLSVHWLGPKDDIGGIVQRWFKSNETTLRNGHTATLSALNNLFESVAAIDSTVNTHVTAEVVTAP